MARMTPDEWRKKREEEKKQETGKAPATSSTTETESSGDTVKRMTPSEWKAKKSSTSFDYWAKSSTSLLDEIYSKANSWSYKNEHSTYSTRISDLLAQADNWRKQYAGNQEAVSYIDSVAAALGDMKRQASDIASFYSQWETEDQYNFWDSRNTTEKRQQLYSDNQSRIKELEDFYDSAYAVESWYSSYQMNPDAWDANVVNRNLDIYNRLKNEYGSLENIEAELEQLYADNTNYERGNYNQYGQMYGNKTIDDYTAKYLSNPEFIQAASNREYGNASVEDLMRYNTLNDTTTWTYDVDGTLRSADGTVIVEDGKGGMINPDSIGLNTINDRVGMYVNATDEERGMAFGTGMGPLRDVFAEGAKRHWELLSEDELTIYYGLLKQQGQAAADKFLDEIQTTLDMRSTQEDIERYKGVYDESGFLEKIMLSAATIPSQLEANIFGGVEDAIALLKGEDINPYSTAHGGMHYSQTIRGKRTEELDATGIHILPGFSLGDLYQSGMSMGDSLLAMGVGGAYGGALLAMGAAENEAYKLYQQGASTEQIAMGALLAGTAEMVFESISIGELKKIKNMKSPETIAQFFKTLLVQGGVEASEEFATEIANAFTNHWVMGSQSDFEKLLSEKGGNLGEALLQKFLDALHAGLSGFFSGAGSGTIVGGSSYLGNMAQFNETGSDVMKSGDVEALKALAMDVSGAKGSLARQAKRMTSETATGTGIGKAVAGAKNLSNRINVGRVAHNVGEGVTYQNLADIKKALARKGFSPNNVERIGNYLHKAANGGVFTTEEANEVAGNQRIVEVLRDVVGNPESTIHQRTQRFVDAVAGKAPTASTASETAPKGNTGIPSETSYTVSEGGQTKLDGNAVQLRGLRKLEDGSIVVATADDQTADPSEIEYSHKGQALVFESYASPNVHSSNPVIDKMPVADRSALAMSYDPSSGIDGKLWVTGSNEAYWYGFEGIDHKTLPTSSFAKYLPQEQITKAYALGRAAAEASAKAQSAGIQAAYEQAVEKLGGKEGAKVAVKKAGKVILEHGVSEEAMTEKQKASFNMIQAIASTSGTTVHIYDGGDNTERGYYDPNTGDVWLNITADEDAGKGNTFLVFTLGHELVHKAKDLSPAKFKKFADTLLEKYGEKGISVEDLIQKKIKQYAEHDITLDEHAAWEEVIADACQAMLLDTNAVETMAEFRDANPGFWQKIVDTIKEFIEKIRLALKGVEPDSEEAHHFKELDAAAQKILENLFVDMVMDASQKGAVIKAANGTLSVEQYMETKDIKYNMAAVNKHKSNLEAKYSEESTVPLVTLMARYNKIIDIWTKLGGELNSQFLKDWDSKVGTDRTFTIFKAQSGYKYNVELSSMCKKGVPLFEAIDTIVKQEVMKELGIETLGKAEKEILYDILKSHHFEIPCAICYVEQARQREGAIIDAFLNGKVVKNASGKTTQFKLGWNEVLDAIESEMRANGVEYSFAQVSRDLATEAYAPANLDMDEKTQAAFFEALKKIANREIARYNKDEKKSRSLLSDVTPESVKACFKGTLPSNLKIFKVLFQEPSSRFKIQHDLLYSSIATQNLSKAHHELYGLFNSQGGVSGYKTKQGTTIYWGDILSKSWTPNTLRKEGGVRNQSNSDFQIYTLLDQAQMYIDFTAKGYYLQAYTKVLSELKLFGLSRGKINASLIPRVVVYHNADGSVDVERTMATAGLDENGNPIYDDIEGINHAEAFMLIADPEYSKSITGICIGYSDAHIRKLLDVDGVQLIIGFHDKTDDGEKRYRGARYAKNYNGLNEAVKYDAEGKPKTVHIGFNPYVKKAEGRFRYNEETETFEGTTTFKGKEYTADDIPRLAADMYLDMCEKKGYVPAYADFKDHRNYYKLLADFGLYDSQGHYAPHRKVAYNMPDQVPYLDANGNKQYMKSYDYIREELRRELIVRDDISAALADQSSEGIIPQFKAKVEEMRGHKIPEGAKRAMPKVHSDAAEMFGTTTDFEEAGFILPSGELLKFTDEKHRGKRQYDHRAIGMVYGVDVNLNVNRGYNKESNKHLDDFVEKGGIRFDPGSLEFNFDAMMQMSKDVPLTKAQEQAIREFVEWKKQREEMYNPDDDPLSLYRGPLSLRIDFGSTSGVAISADRGELGIKQLVYEGGQINASRIIADIRHYYATGEIRQPSRVAQFRYSMPKAPGNASDIIASLYNYDTVNFDRAVVDFNTEHFMEQWGKGYYGSVVDAISKQTGKSKREVWSAFAGILMRSEGIAKVDGKTYINVHELNEANLRKAFELGGLAAPSIGIVDVDKPVTRFGDISLIFPDIFNPETTPTYYGDSYSSSFPAVGRFTDETMLTDALIDGIDGMEWGGILTNEEVAELLEDLYQVYFYDDEQRTAHAISRNGFANPKEFARNYNIKGIGGLQKLYEGLKDQYDSYEMFLEDFAEKAFTNQRMHRTYTGNPDFDWNNRVYQFNAYSLDNVVEEMTSRGAEDFRMSLGEKATDYGELTSDGMRARLKAGGESFYEVKPQRAVYIGEATYAVVPENTSADVIEMLEAEGVEVVKYQRNDGYDGIAAGRSEAIKGILETDTTGIRYAMPRGKSKAKGKSKVNGKSKPNGKSTPNGKPKPNGRTFSYQELVAKGSIVGEVIDRNTYVRMKGRLLDEAWLVNLVRSKCKQISTKSVEPTYYAEVPDIGRNVEIVRDGILHGCGNYKKNSNGVLPDPAILNARITTNIVNILRTAIEVNHSSRGNNIDVPFTHIMLGVAGLENTDGTIDYYAVRIEIQERANQVPILAGANVLGKLFAVNANKISSPHAQVTDSAGVALTMGSFVYSVADLLNDVKLVFDDTFSVDVYKKLRTSRNKTVFSTNLLYKAPHSRGLSPRQLLADAFEEMVQTPQERQMIDEYRANISKVEDVQERLKKVRAKIHELTVSKGDKSKIAALNKTASELAALIDSYDRKLLEMEGSKPLRDVLTRAKQAAYRDAKQRGEKLMAEYRQQVSERFDRGVESRKKTAMRAKIRKTIRDLDKILNRGDKKRNVKEGMKGFVEEALASAEILFTENYGNEDMIRNGVEVEMTPEEEKYMTEARAILAELYNLPSGSYEAWAERQGVEESLKSKLAYRMGKLKDVFYRERLRLNKTKVADVLSKLADAYAKLETSEYAYVSGAYNEAIHQYLKTLQEEVGGATIRDMSLNQLELMHTAYTMVLHSVRKANEMFTEGWTKRRDELANGIMFEVKDAGGVHGRWSAAEVARNRASWNNTKPIYAAERIGSETFKQLWAGLFKGQYNWAVDMEEAKAFRQKLAEKYGVKNWDMEKLYTFTSASGLEFQLNLNQIMSIYAYSKREQAHDHLTKGGFVFGKDTEVIVNKHGIKVTYYDRSATAYKLSDELVEDIVSMLDTVPGAKQFVDEMQDYLSTTMGEKGNEVSMKLYGVKLFNEAFYFPLRSAGQYMERAKEADLKKQQGQVSIVNSSFTHATKPKANNPVVLEGFMDVWASHVNEMSMYHSMVLPMEDFRRVYNYSSPNMEGQDSVSVNSVIENAYGPEATGYIDQLYKELNGGAVTDPRETAFKERIGKFKKAAVMLSSSVVVQQFSAIGRAYALIDPKYFIGAKVDKHRQAAAWEEMKRYAPVAIIKEMGGFDTHTGGSAKDYLLAEEYGKGERISGLIKDEQYRSEIMGWAPAKADELTWCAIWEAVKRETKAKHPELDVKSEEFLKAAGERFSEVIEKTQVYDSVLARSANMRSKNGLMQMATAFMAEPTTTVNMIEDALRKKDKKYIARTFASVFASIVINNALASIVYAMRDDDDDETFLEKYTQALVSGMLDDLNPMTYYPFLKDVWSLLQGYDVERSDMSVVSDVTDAVKRLATTFAKFDEDMDEEEMAEYYKEIGTGLMGLLDAGCTALGIPEKNVRREITAIVNTFKTFSKTFGSTTWNSFVDAIGSSALDSIPIVGLFGGESRTDKLYDAIVSGDSTYLARLKAGYKSEDSYNAAVRKALRENDPRIHQAALAGYNGDPSERVRIARLIIADGFSQDNVVAAINAEINNMKPDEPKSDPKAKGFYTAEDFAREIANGDQAAANAAKVDVIQTAQKNGKSAEEATKSFVSSAKSELKDLFLVGRISEQKAINALTTYCDMDEADAIADVQYWAFKNDYPDVFVDDQWFDTYYEKIADSGIEIDVYMEYRNAVAGITGENKKSGRMSVINSLPITSAQKDALYLAEGWAASKLNEAPWH